MPVLKIDRAILAGFQRHMAKPVGPIELITYVVTLVGRTLGDELLMLKDKLDPGTTDLSAKPRRVLLIEDHNSSREALATMLRRRHRVVETVASIEGARTAVQTKPFDLVVSDLSIPDGSGNDLMAELQTLFGLKGIALSGYDRDDDIVLSRKPVFIAHLTKPVSIDLLHREIIKATTKT